MDYFDSFGIQMAAAPWRERMAWGNTQGRNIARQADGLRIALARFADGQGSLAEVESAAQAIAGQLALVRAQAAAVARHRGAKGLFAPILEAEGERPASTDRAPF